MALSTDARTYRWAAHRWRARLVRALAYACPLALSLAFVYAGSAAVPPPTSSLWAYLAWWLAISLGATLVISLGYRVTRRLLPLGAMLELSLIFPDRAPSRFEVALRTRTVDSLLERLQQPATTEQELSAQEAAEILLELVAALSEHDRVTRGHAERVRAYAAMLGERLGLPDDDLDRLNWAALLHDVGKLLVSAEILNKPGKPTEEEWEALRLHPLHGERLVAPLRHWLGEWADAVGHHHERWDGNGYPRGLAGEEIARAGRIVAIADVFDVMTSARSYKLGSSAAAAREELVRCAGSQFDPRLVRAFVDVSLGPMRLVVGPLSWLLHAPILSRIPLAPSLGAAAGGVAAVATIASGVASSPTQAAPTARPVSQPPPRVSTGTTASGPPSRALRVARPGRAAEESRPEGTGGDGPRIADEAPAPAPPDPAPEPPAPTPSPDPPPAPDPPPQPPPTDPEPSPPQPTPNQPPSFTPGGSQSVVEDGGPQSHAGWASAISPGPAAESSQRVTFSVTTDRPELFSSPPTVSSDGALSYTPAPDAFGVATVTVIARDDGGTADGGIDTSAPAAFSVTIRPVNDRPSFTAGGNDTAISLLGARTVSGWATSISCGPSNESSQSLRFVVAVDKPGLFTVQPAISPDGTLTYTPRLLALGVATATVRLVDDGGTEDGGSDSSAPATFTITIV